MKVIEDKFTIKKRSSHSHKYDYGSILVVGGNVGMTGAPLMTAYSAMRTGSGLATIGIKESYMHLVNNIYPEIMVRPYGNKKEFLDLIVKKTAIAFGPGLGRADDVKPILSGLLEMEIPLVIDADGIYYFKDQVNRIKDPQKIVITPHHGEMAMFLGTDSKSVMEDPVKAARQVSELYGINVVLKGADTYISDTREIYRSSLGNPGMATAGSGDVLTGIITSLIGQGIGVLESCKLGVYIHSKAGELAAMKYGEYSLMATDIIHSIPQILKELVQ